MPRSSLSEARSAAPRGPHRDAQRTVSGTAEHTQQRQQTETAAALPALYDIGPHVAHCEQAVSRCSFQASLRSADQGKQQSAEAEPYSCLAQTAPPWPDISTSGAAIRAGMCPVQEAKRRCSV